MRTGNLSHENICSSLAKDDSKRLKNFFDLAVIVISRKMHGTSRTPVFLTSLGGGGGGSGKSHSFNSFLLAREN